MYPHPGLIAQSASMVWLLVYFGRIVSMAPSSTTTHGASSTSFLVRGLPSLRTTIVWSAVAGCLDYRETAVIRVAVVPSRCMIFALEKKYARHAVSLVVRQGDAMRKASLADDSFPSGKPKAPSANAHGARRFRTDLVQAGKLGCGRKCVRGGGAGNALVEGEK